MRDCVQEMDDILEEIVKGFFIAIVIIGSILTYVVINYTPTVKDTEYFEDSNCSVTKTYCLKGVDYINVYSECGDISVQNSDYYRYYTNKIGESVTEKFEKTSYSDGSVHLKIYEIIDNEQ